MATRVDEGNSENTSVVNPKFYKQPRDYVYDIEGRILLRTEFCRELDARTLQGVVRL